MLAAALALAAAGLVTGGVDAGATTTASRTLVPLVGTSAAPPTGATVLGPTATSAPITVDVALRPAHPAALAAYGLAVSTPGNPLFHHYLTPDEAAAEFGPAPATLDATRSWLSSAGLRVGAAIGDRLLLPVSGTATQIETAFRVPLVRARLRDGRTVRLGTRDPSVPSALAASLDGVIGLSDQALAHPQLVRPSGRLATRTPSSALAQTAHGSSGPQACPAASSSGNDAQTANELASTYGLSALYAAGKVGAGQTVGIFELEPFTASDIQAYQNCYGTKVPVSTVPVDLGATGAQIGEAALDIEVVAGMAPGASITVYSGPNDGGAGPIDTYAEMVQPTHRETLPKVLSTSWGQCEPEMDPSDRDTERTLFDLAATEGQTILAASGDAGSSDCYDPEVSGSPTGLAVDDPADQPGVTGVGGTSLVSDAANAPVETTWNSDGGAGGGGNSAYFAASSWQEVPAARSSSTSYTCNGSQQCREVPDVSASADPNSGYAVYWGGHWEPIGGTSGAAPLWAALVADIDQGCASSAGFLDPTLYSSGAASDFNDVTLGDNSLFGGSQYSAGPGYDLATGWGSPKAGALLALVSGSAAGCPTVTGLSPSSGPALGGEPVTITGTGFGTGTPVVRFGGVTATVTASSPTSITAISPNVTVGGTATVTVTTTGTAAGTSPSEAAAVFTFLSPRVSSVVANHGPTSGGGRVTITGSGFEAADTVTFGSRPATGVTFVSPTTIEATVPAGSAATSPVEVVVTGSTGSSPVTSGSNYYYDPSGYLMVASDGGVFTYGGAGFHGSAAGAARAAPVVATAMTPNARGYWMVGSTGQVFAYGSAGYYGALGGQALARPVVGMATTPDGAGYWLVASDGGIFAFGDAAFHGSTGNIHLNQPIVGMAATPDGRGYWLVAADGGIFAFGDAAFHGSTGNIHLNRPIVGMAVDLTGDGYWLTASDGGIFAFGAAPFYGSTGDIVLNSPIVGMAAT